MGGFSALVRQNKLRFNAEKSVKVGRMGMYILQRTILKKQPFVF